MLKYKLQETFFQLVVGVCYHIFLSLCEKDLKAIQLQCDLKCIWISDFIQNLIWTDPFIDLHAQCSFLLFLPAFMLCLQSYIYSALSIFKLTARFHIFVTDSVKKMTNLNKDMSKTTNVAGRLQKHTTVTKYLSFQQEIQTL